MPVQFQPFFVSVLHFENLQSSKLSGLLIICFIFTVQFGTKTKLTTNIFRMAHGVGNQNINLDCAEGAEYMFCSLCLLTL